MTPTRKPKKKKPADRTRVRLGRKVADEAIARAAEIKAAGEPTRSTAARHAYHHKAQTLDRVARILAGNIDDE